MTRHERVRSTKKQIISLRAVAAADDVDVASAARDDQPDRRALAFDERVDSNRRAMDQTVDRARIEIGFANAIDEAFDWITGRGETLGMLNPFRMLVEGDQIGKRAANVDGDPQAHHSFPSG